MKGMQEKKECAFCPRPVDKSGNEHIWSKWISDLLGPGRIYSFTLRKKEQVNKFQDDELKVKSKVVCGDCNHGWMSVVENKAKPVISDMIKHGTPTTLDEKSILAILHFAFLKCVVADHMHDRPPFYSIGERYSFRKSLAVPAGAHLWLARTPVDRGLFKSTTVQLPPEMTNRFELNTFTFGVGRFLMQFVCFQWTHKRTRRTTKPDRLSQNLYWSRYAIAVWPLPYLGISWPPPFDLPRAGEQDFILRWGKLIRNRLV